MPDNQEPKELEQKGDLSDKLLPCPFCQSTIIKHYLPSCNPARETWITCLTCHASCGMHLNEDMAISAWNIRSSSRQLTATQQALDSAVEALKEIIKEVRKETAPFKKDELGKFIDYLYGKLRTIGELAQEAALASIKE